MLTGLCFPLGGMLWTNTIDVMYSPNPKDMRNKSYLYASIWLGLGLLQTFSTWLQYGGFVTAAQRLVRKLRAQSFSSSRTGQFCLRRRTLRC